MAAPLLGRKESLARASGWLGVLLQGRGGVLFVVGEAGIGKTRLIDELRNSARSAAPEPLPVEPVGHVPARERLHVQL